MADEAKSRILRMVSEGKLSPEEAAQLLEASEPARVDERRERREHRERWHEHRLPEPAEPPNNRNLIIHIEDDGEEKVHLRIPLGLARAAGRFIPRQAKQHLKEYDIDLEEMMADLGSSLPPGPLLQVTEDDNKVLIAVE